MNKYFHPQHGYLAAMSSFTSALLSSFGWLKSSHEPLTAFEVPGDFFGVNVAPGDAPATDAYVLARLGDLQLRQVRMDFSYGSHEGPAQRLLDTLLEQGYSVILDVFPSREEALLLSSDEGARQRWSAFLGELFDRYQQRVEYFEIGNTPNRGRWSGFSSRSFLVAWQIAMEQAAERPVLLAGPNVSDFEPLYNASYLSMIGKSGKSPEVHTDNLFVERVIEPEAYDHRVLGRQLTSTLKLNLIKKANILAAIGRQAGCQELVCTYTCWTRKRLARRSAWPEQKQADYLTRYLLLAASSGALRRVYWGPLICHRDGLIDDAATDYPVVDQVSFYEKIRGEPEDFKITPGFSALGFLNRRLAGARGDGCLHQPDGLSLFRFQTAEGGALLVAWCRDGLTWSLGEILPAALLAQATFHDSQGQRLDTPAVVSEQPLFIDFPPADTGPTAVDWLPPEPPVEGIIHLSAPQHQSAELAGQGWQGACMLRRSRQLADLAAAELLYPEAVAKLPETRVMRDVRNRLWNVDDPRGICDQVTVKLNRVKGIKRFTYRFRPSKGRRHWNNACELIRRGVTTPMPVAFFERPEHSGIRESWYLCEFIPDAFSARDVYAAFRDGAEDYRGLDKRAWLDLLSEFVCNMHNKQIIHRDLSAGNLLLVQAPNGEITPQAIDIGRAKIWFGPGSSVTQSDRLLDLIRIGYKLDWNDRELFVECYEQHLGKSLSPLWRVPFFYYDSKQTIKKTLKGKRSKRKKTTR